MVRKLQAIKKTFSPESGESSEYKRLEVTGGSAYAGAAVYMSSRT
ncbi:MAG: hypothetical protein ACTMUB_09895 [cyanobacterium endosymbiont of Rhopalodia musculus]|nr:hypothetical protein [cyanobacterium endosymbiont of Epithemia clementina EcSB]WGT68345.1 hypothetical protein P3F56_04680 [cyanobacterium endosymbiont of Epithemia clementina EcSB]